MSSLPRGTGTLGFYEERSQDVADRQHPAGEPVAASGAAVVPISRHGSASFADYVRARANRKDDFFIRPAGGVDLCNAPVPVRPAPAR
jgi:peptidylprolyl isomerase